MKHFEVLIADDSDRARQGVRLILDADAQFQVVAEAKNGLEAIELTKTRIPDLVLMDINMPGMNGLQATRTIKQEFPYVTVVILSVSDDAADLFDAIRSGAQGYLVKSLQPSDWISYLHGVLDGEAPVSRSMAEKILGEFTRLPAPPVSHESGATLTARECEILGLVSTGATNRDIATKLFISENTVKNHLKNIMEKLHIQNRVQLATYASRSNTADSYGSI